MYNKTLALLTTVHRSMLIIVQRVLKFEVIKAFKSQNSENGAHATIV